MFPYPSSIPVICVATRPPPGFCLANSCCHLEASAVLRSSVQRPREDGKSATLCNNPFVLQFRTVLFLACVRFSLKKQSEISKVSLQQRNAFAWLLSVLVWFCSCAFSTDTYRRWGCGLIREEYQKSKERMRMWRDDDDYCYDYYLFLLLLWV